MSSPLRPPAGFDVREGPDASLIVRRGLAEPFVKQGLDSTVGWDRLLPAASPPSGRGSTARLSLPGGERLLLKKLLRGGLAGRIRRELFAGTGRLLDNIRLPLEALSRGVPTAAPAALLVSPGPGGLYRGWLATEEISGASDLSARYACGSAPSDGELRAAMTAVRTMHDTGLAHPDLNLGNLLVRGEAGECEAFVIDLDKASLHDGPLPVRMRRAALRRLERSYVKRCHLTGARSERSERERFYRLYAAGESGLAAELTRGRALGALLIFLHKAWWLVAR